MSSLDQIEARLRQLEHEEMNRMATRTHLLALRKREDEEFRRMTESAEAEEEVCIMISADKLFVIDINILRTCENNERK